MGLPTWMRGRVVISVACFLAGIVFQRLSGHISSSLATATGRHGKLVQAMPGVWVDPRTDQGFETLLWAVTIGDDDSVQLVKELLAGGANVNQGEGAYPALHAAVFYGKVNLAKVLLDAGADVRTTAYGGKSSLHSAIEGRSLQCAQLLLARGADPNAADSDGRTPLHVAAQSGDLPACNALLEAGANLAARDKTGQTPAQLAGRGGHADVAAWLRNRERDSPSRGPSPSPN